VETVSLIASVVAIILAFFAIWQAHEHKKESDKLNRDTTEKLSKIEAFATMTRDDAFAEIKRWGDFARAGGKDVEEAEKAKKEELKKLKIELEKTTAEQINKVLKSVEDSVSSSSTTTAITEIRKEFEELKNEIGKIQEKGLGEVKRLDVKEKFNRLWHSLTMKQKKLLVKISNNPDVSQQDLELAGLSRDSMLFAFFNDLRGIGALRAAYSVDGTNFCILLTDDFKEFVLNK